MDGDELCRQVRRRQWNSYIYIVLVTSFDGIDHVVEGLRAGADDFLSKPYHPDELRVRLRTGERLLSLESRDAMLFTLAKLTESRDKDTGMHLDRMREYCRVLAQELSGWKQYRDEIDGEYIQLLYLTSPLHDIGKIGIPDRVLLKPGPLTKEEFEIMKQHTTIGGETLRVVTEAHPEARYLAMARDIAFSHHEHFDGSGYPFGLRGRDIPLCGRLTALPDVYDALTSRRVYKSKMSHDEAREIILKGAGTQFDPDVTEAFLRREDDIIRIAHMLDEPNPAKEPVPLEPVADPQTA
jgi:putative two-component system response regulator